MVWARIDDEILDNPKIIQVGAMGFALHVAAITWCNRNLTDGFVPSIKAKALLDMDGLVEQTSSGEFSDGYSPVTWRHVAERLVNAGLWTWDEERGGYWLHDFLKYNPSRADVLAKRDKEASKKRSARRSEPSPPDRPRGSPLGTPRGTPEETTLVSLASPDPDPDPVKSPLPPRGGGGSERVAEIGTALALEAVATYEQAVAEVTGKPCALPNRREHRSDICTAINGHCPERSPPRVLDWLADAVADWVRMHRDRAQYTAGWAPRQFLNWLNADRPPPTVTLLRTGTDGGASPRARRNMNDFRP